MISLLERCIEDDPAERPADAHVLADELNKILRSSSADAPVLEVKPAATAVPVVPPPLPSRTQPPPLAVALPVTGAPPELPGTQVPVAKQVACGIIAPVAMILAVVPLLILLVGNNPSGDALLGFLCLLLISFGGWFGAARLARWPWARIGIFVVVCLGISIVLASFVAFSGDRRSSRGYEYKDKDLDVKKK
jgi:hypothetical protein